MKNITWGITSESHDASLSVINNDQILFASHSERFSKIKNDKFLHHDLIKYALGFGIPEKIYFYENPLKKLTRQIYAGQWKFLKEESIKTKLYTSFRDLVQADIEYVDHHKAHAAAGYFTSTYSDATILVVDAIGEWTTTSIWSGKGKKLAKLWSTKYPNSLGLWYSAMTQRVGLKPNEEEYIFMGMSALGDPEKYYSGIRETFFKPGETFKLKHNLHKGCKWWRLGESLDYNYDVAAATQQIFEEEYEKLILLSKKLNNSNNLILMGGCALNCVANSKISHYYKNIWIMPNPGDAGSSLGAAIVGRGDFVDWKGPLLGYNIKGSYPIDDLISDLEKDKIAAVASGRAEFGPRALGNRSILADPRGDDVKDRVNHIKKREPFRPFAPAILEECVHEYFDMPMGVDKSPYMQFIGKCKFPDKFPAIIHYDGTSRVQTVNPREYPDFYNLIFKWYKKTGCPMLLNTSLNIKGQPLINDENDVIEFSKLHNIQVRS